MEKLWHKGLKPPDKGSRQQNPCIDLIAQKSEVSLPNNIPKEAFLHLHILLVDNKMSKLNKMQLIMCSIA